MKSILVAATALCTLPALAFAAPASVSPARHFPRPRQCGYSPQSSRATRSISRAPPMAGPGHGQAPVDATTGAKVVMNTSRRSWSPPVYSMDNIVWLQIFHHDLKYYGDFNTVYRTYFKGPLPARAFHRCRQPAGQCRNFEVNGQWRSKAPRRVSRRRA